MHHRQSANRGSPNVTKNPSQVDETTEARELLRENWQLGAEAFANTTPRIPFLCHVIALLESRPHTPFLGQLKALITEPELPVTPGVAVPWDIAHFIEQLGPRLPEGTIEFLTALNDRANNLPALDHFEEWRNEPTIALDAPWPSD
jgi:hypothetical protein